MNATFLVKSIFEIKGHGRVIGGDILEGTVQIGMLAGPEGETPAGTWQITGVEHINSVKINESHVALLFAKGPSVAQMKQLTPPGSRLFIREA
jgi:hypothetical protein